MTSVLNSMIAGLHLDERRSKENGQDVVRRSLYKYICLVCGALVLGGLYRCGMRLPLCFSIGFLQGPRARAASVKFRRGGLSKCCSRLRNFATLVRDKGKERKPSYCLGKSEKGTKIEACLIALSILFVLSSRTFLVQCSRDTPKYEIPIIILIANIIADGTAITWTIIFTVLSFSLSYFLPRGIRLGRIL